MNRRSALILFSVGMLGAGAAHAGGFVDDILAQLKRQGFEAQQVQKTWLGRVRIVAQNSEGSREIIVNPNTGEILRDLWTPLPTSGDYKPPLISETGGNSSAGGGTAGEDGGSDDHHSDDGGNDHDTQDGGDHGKDD